MLIYAVDDERVIASTLAVILRQAAYQAQAFFDAASALTAAKLLPPDLLITDINMPVMDGCELASEMTFLHPSCKVLLFSGNDHYDLATDVRHSAKNWSFLRKTLSPSDLLLTVASQLHKDAVLETPPLVLHAASTRAVELSARSRPSGNSLNQAD